MSMSKAERDGLLSIVKSRTKVLKHAADLRAKELLGEFEQQISTEWKFDQDEVWRQQAEAVKEAVQEAQEKIAARSRALGIPDQFAPSIQVYWQKRGENLMAERRSELRRAAKAKIEELHQRARVHIETAMSDAEVRIMASALTSEAAKEFLDGLPRVETLMPAIELAKLDAPKHPQGSPGLRLVTDE